MIRKLMYLVVGLVIVLSFSGCQEMNQNNPVYAVTFYNEQGEIIKITSVEKGGQVTAPTPPDKTGHVFVSWEPDLTNIGQNLDVYPIYEKESYRLSVHLIDEVETNYVLYEENISLSESAIEGYQFLGWYLDAQYSILFGYEAIPHFNLDVYAKYEPIMYQIIIEHEDYEPLNFHFLEPIELLDAEKEGHMFIGWYLDAQYQDPLDFEFMPAYDVTLFPKFEILSYTLSFVTNIATSIEDHRYAYNALIELPILESEDMRFLGWYLDQDLSLSFDVDLMPNHDLMLYAKWETMTPLYIRVVGDQLYLGDELFRFVSFNVPNLHILEDPDWHMADPFEQDDALHSLKLMGGRVARIYTLSIIGGIRPMEKNNELAHIMGIETYNEALFQSLDKALELAGQYGIYLIIPFIDEWNWFGGTEEFSALYGQNRNAFFTNPTIKNGFKHLMSYVLNRVNTYTGIAYKDDPNILAFELGNELRSAPNAWIEEMSAYFKSINHNHLLMSGKDEVTTHDLNNPHIDIINAHYYTNNGTGTFASRAKRDRDLTKGIKPFIIGEYGLVSYDEIEAMIIESVENGTSGSLIWSLRFRNVKGGFYYHNDTPTRSYHYPGFDINDDYQESAIVQLITYYAHIVSGKEITNPPIPKAPVLFDIDEGAISWQGQTATESFIIERRIFGHESWEVIAMNVIDAYEQGPFHIDLSGQDGVLYEYRVMGVNVSGVSEPSNSVLYTYQEIYVEVNLALNQTVEASSVEYTQGIPRAAQYVIDGDYQTRWSSLYQDQQWIEIIFFETVMISKSIIYFEAAYAKSYCILGSIDRMTYVFLYENDNAEGGVITIEIEPVEIKYLKLDLIERKTQWGFSMYEIEVY